MASNYPGSLDSFDTIASDKKTSDAVGGRTHRAMHNDLGDAIEAVQTELGTNPSGSESTVAARLDKIEDGTRLGANSVGATQIADNAVDTNAIADGAATPAKLATTGRFVFPTGAANGYGFASGAVHLSGTGAPEGAVTAPPGSTWLQTDSTTDVKGWIRWQKATGTGSTGWVAGAEADTGPRVVTVDGAGWSGALLLRRIGCQVQVYTDSLNVPIMPASGTQIMTLPAGFTAALGTYPGVAYNLWTGAILGVVVTGTNNLSVAGDLLATRGLAPLLTFISPADWPASLPGSAG